MPDLQMGVPSPADLIDDATSSQSRYRNPDAVTARDRWLRVEQGEEAHGRRHAPLVQVERLPERLAHRLGRGTVLIEQLVELRFGQGNTCQGFLICR